MRLVLTGLALALAGAFATGCVSKGKYELEKARADRLGRELSDARLMSAKQKKKLADLDAQLDKVRSELKKRIDELSNMKNLTAEQRAKLKASADDLNRLSSSLANMKSKGKAKDEELAKIRKALAEMEKLKQKLLAEKRFNDSLMAAFRNMIKAGTLSIVRVGNRLVIKMKSSILFRSGSSKLTSAGEEAIKQIANVLKKVPRHFQIAGHTDSIPLRGSKKHKDNWDLAANRAMGVLRVLQENGVPGKNLSAAGYGAFQPIHTNATKWGRAQNRRIEITLYPIIPPRLKGT